MAGADGVEDAFRPVPAVDQFRHGEPGVEDEQGVRAGGVFAQIRLRPGEAPQDVRLRNVVSAGENAVADARGQQVRPRHPQVVEVQLVAGAAERLENPQVAAARERALERERRAAGRERPDAAERLLGGFERRKPDVERRGALRHEIRVHELHVPRPLPQVAQRERRLAGSVRSGHDVANGGRGGHLE